MTIFRGCKVIEKDGKLGIDISSRYPEEFQEALRSFKDGFVQVVLKRPSKSKTEAQRKTFHALYRLYYKSGLHSSKSYDALKVDLKVRYGWVFDYDVDGETYRVVVSTEKYTMEWYSRLIDGTISEMEQSGILVSQYANEYQEIRRGMESES
jgi:hypothetical protein